MGNLSIHPTVKRMYPHNFVAPSEYEQGKHLYRTGRKIRECVTDEMTRGYMDAAEAGRRAYLRACQAESVEPWMGV